jgi:DnaK suppressor protein
MPWRRTRSPGNSRRATALDLTGYRKKLEERRAEIRRLQDMSVSSRSAVELDQTSVGRVSRIDAIQAQQMALAAQRKRKSELAMIETALARIADGSFGECVDCGEDIALKRLDFDPTVTTCFACASDGRR